MDAPCPGVEWARMEMLLTPDEKVTATTEIMTISLDLAKTVFQVHGADGEGRAVLRKRLKRGQALEFFVSIPSCLVGLEA